MLRQVVGFIERTHNQCDSESTKFQDTDPRLFTAPLFSADPRRVWSQKLIRVESVRLGETVNGGKAQIAFSSGLERLVVLVRESRLLSEAFLSVPVSLP